MSFTVYKKKLNGEMVPIKMSIWDAFQGAPNPKPKRRDPCACCGKYHGMTNNAREQFKKDQCVRNGGSGVPGKQIEGIGGSKNDEKKGDKGDDTTSKQNTFSTFEQETFTDADDATILQMKGEGKSWNEIKDALGKNSKSQVQARHKQLVAKPDVATAEAGKSGANNKQDNKEAKAAKNKEEGLKKQAETKNEKEGKGKKDKSKGAEKKDEKAASKEADGAVKAWADRYDKQKWVAIASKHFDQTGQRITAEQARKLAEGK